MSALLLLCSLLIERASACGVEGTVMGSDGKPASGGSISTNLGEKSATVKKGHYVIELGDTACAVAVTVYLDKGQATSVITPKQGNVQVNFAK